MAGSLAEDQTSQAQEHCSLHRTSTVHSEGTERHCSLQRSSIVHAEDGREEHCSPLRSSIVLSEGTEEHCSSIMSSTVHSEGRQCYRARDSGHFVEVMSLVTPERGADAGRRAELAKAVMCRAHETESEAVPEAPGLVSRVAEKSKWHKSVTHVAVAPARAAKQPVAALCNIAPRRVSVTRMLRRGWRSTGGGASPVTVTPPRLRQPAQSRPCKEHNWRAQTDHRVDHLATVLSAAQKATFVLLGTTFAVFTMIELAWRLGPDPEPFS